MTRTVNANSKQTLLALALLTLGQAAGAAAQQSPEVVPRFSGLESLYFERLADPGEATSSLRRGGGGPVDEELRRLLPAVLESGDEPVLEERVIDPSEGPIHFGIQVCDLTLPGFPEDAGAFLRQVVDGTHPRIHEQFWGLYAGGIRTDLWFFSPTPERTDSKLLATLAVEDVLRPDTTRLVLRASGTMIRPMGAGWLQGVDLVFTVGGAKLLYHHNVRRYSFTYGYDRGGGRSSLVTTELARQEGARIVLEQRLSFDVPPGLSAKCGIEPELSFPSGDFDKLAEIATCITSAPGAVLRQRGTEEPSFIERGGKPASAEAPTAPAGNRRDEG